MTEQPNQREIDELVEEAKNYIATVIGAYWLSEIARPNYVAVAPEGKLGLSDVAFLRAEIGVTLFVKYHPELVERELDGYKILCKGPRSFRRHLVPPLPSHGAPRFWLAPYLNQNSLHDLVCMIGRVSRPDRSEEFIRQVYDDVLRKLAVLWRWTRCKFADFIRHENLRKFANSCLKLQN